MSAQGLSSAKKRRGVPPGNTKIGSAPAPVGTQRPPSKISTQDAIYLLNSRIMSLEGMLKNNLKQIETKFGEQDTYITDNLPDINLINQAFSDINSRLIELETLENRLSVVEGKLDIKKKSPKKKASTEILEEPTAKGISFSINED